MPATTLGYHSTFTSWASKPNSASSNEENPLAISYVMISLILQLLLLPLVSPLISYSCLSTLSFLHFCAWVLLSSTSYITDALTLAIGHPGLEIKMLYWCTLYSIIKDTEAQPRESACQTPETTYLIGTCKCTSTSLKVYILKVCMQGTYCDIIVFNPGLKVLFTLIPCVSSPKTFW